MPTKSPVPSPTVMPTDIWATEPADTPTIEPSDIPTEKPDGTPTTEPTNTPSKVPSDSTTSLPSESPAPDTSVVSDMYQITLRINGKDFPAELYQTETTKSIMQKLPLSITMSELNGYVENPDGLAEVLGTGSVHVDVLRNCRKINDAS